MTKAARGRPANPEKQQAQKDLLLDAAYALLKEKTYRSITIREIAENAGMKSAMISYYFANKEGLFVALVERFASVNLSRMSVALQSSEPIKGFIQTAISHLSENPALSRFIADEVLSQDSLLAQSIVNAMPKKVAQFLPMLMKNLQDKKELRSDIDPKWAAFSLITMILMPFIGARVRDDAWGISHEEVSSPEWVDHIYRLFIAGCGNRTVNSIKSVANQKSQ